MDYNIFIRPLIGAGIGYITNWIAVKMLFRPLKPIKIGKFTLPFTPGIIPRNKSRLAETIGYTISKDLLSENDLKNALLSDNIKNKIEQNIIQYINSLDNQSLEDFICLYIEKDAYDKILYNIKSNISINIYNTVLEANLGNIIAEQIELATSEKLKGSILGIFGGNAIASSITSNVSTKLNEYISINGKNLIEEMVEKNLQKYTSKSVNNLSNDIKNSDIDIMSIIMKIYENIVLEKTSTFLEALDISKIITEKINSMDVLELEKMILVIMKKELNALVNLGAVIGLILGMLNLLF